MTVKGHFTLLCNSYVNEVLHSNVASTDAVLAKCVRHLVVELEQLWQHLSAVGAFSMNDELDDYSTTALEMLWTPYVIGDLYQRQQTTSGGSAASTQRMIGESALQQVEGLQRDGEGGASAPGLVNVSMLSVREDEIRTLSRQEALARSNAWFNIFFEWMQTIGLVDEKTIEACSIYRPDQRTQRIELSRKLSVLRDEWSTGDEKVAYMRAKRRRMAELMKEDGESMEEAGGEEEEVLREAALARLQWSIYDACHQLQLSSRELKMLESLSVEQRASISAQYQKTLDAVRRGEMSLGRHTYTILPGGMMTAGTLQQPQAVRLGDVAQSSGVSLPTALNVNSSPQLFRQQVRNELMMDRNRPTMTLEEFAALEMADIQRQMNEAQRLQQEEAEEVERLGPDGVEERQRAKDSLWADWKDDHPALGVTNKGNYS